MHLITALKNFLNYTVRTPGGRITDLFISASYAYLRHQRLDCDKSWKKKKMHLIAAPQHFQNHTDWPKGELPLRNKINIGVVFTDWPHWGAVCNDMFTVPCVFFSLLILASIISVNTWKSVSP